MTGFCPICGSSGTNAIASYRGQDTMFSGMDVAECGSCGMVFADPMPSREVLSTYNASYFASAHGGVPTQRVAQAFFSGVAKVRLASLDAYLNRRQLTATNVMELGPGLGFFAQSWLDKYPRSTYFACETDISCHTRLQEIGVQIVVEPTTQEVKTAVDLIVMSHVLEHVPSPQDFIAGATQTLRKGGTLFIEVPCRDYLHKPIDEPHLLFFDKAPMQYLLESAGFDDIELGYYGPIIKEIQSASSFGAYWLALRSRLIDKGLTWPFSRKRVGMEMLLHPLERAAIAPFKAHRQASSPAWWLRAIARKC